MILPELSSCRCFVALWGEVVAEGATSQNFPPVYGRGRRLQKVGRGAEAFGALRNPGV